jgi:hypothetical protein
MTSIATRFAVAASITSIGPRRASIPHWRWSSAIICAEWVRNLARSLVVYLKHAGGQSRFSFQTELATAPTRYVETARIDVAGGFRCAFLW